MSASGSSALCRALSFASTMVTSGPAASRIRARWAGVSSRTMRFGVYRIFMDGSSGPTFYGNLGDTEAPHGARQLGAPADDAGGLSPGTELFELRGVVASRGSRSGLPDRGLLPEDRADPGGGPVRPR